MIKAGNMSQNEKKKVARTFRLKIETIDQLKAYAKHYHVSVNELIRRGLLYAIDHPGHAFATDGKKE